MKKGMGITSDDLEKNININNDKDKVVNVEKDEKVAKKGNAAAIIIFSSCAVAAAIILGSVAYQKTLIKNNKNDKQQIEEVDDSYVINSDIVATNNTDIENNDDVTTEETNEETSEYENTKEIDYSNVESFYNHILANRNKYGSFANSFQSEDDVKNFINFLYKFDDLYSDTDIYSTIDSQETYDKIIQDYYNSCVKYDVKGELNLLYANNKLAQNKIAEVETLAYDLKNGKGNDYTIADRYYTWFLVNLIDDRTKVDATTTNAPFIDALREQFEQYRYSGNMLEARKYQKNDSLPVDSIHLYYADEAPEGVEITEVENSLTCPDWGIDNIISKYEEDTEKKLYIKRDGQGTFYRIDEQFEMVLNKGKVK